MKTEIFFKHEWHWLINAGILLLCFKIIRAENVPHIPCPELFKYISSGDKHSGEVTFKKLPLQNTTVEVAFIQRESITSKYYGSLSLSHDLATTQKNLENGMPISYRVDFPDSHIFPKLIGIKVNGDTVCSGEGLDAPSTTFRLRHIFYPCLRATLNRPIHTKTDVNKNIFTSLPNTTTYLDALITQPVNIPQSNIPFSSNNPFFKPQPLNIPQSYIRLSPNNPFFKKKPVSISENSPPQPKPVISQRAYKPVNKPTEQSGNVACGRESLTPFVVEGHDFPRGKFPWLAAIYLRDSADLKFTCGGSLISRRTVITAAHCFPTRNFSPDLISVYLGRHNLFVSEEGSQQRDVASLTIHPNYNISAISDADIALLHLAIEVTFNYYIRPVCLWTQAEDLFYIEGQKGFIAGWGSGNEGNAVTSAAKMVEAKIVSESECLRSSDLFRILTSARSLCAGNRDGSGPCIGDSGGGLMLNVFGVWTLRGILSVGKTVQRNCDLKEYVVYCDVAKHMSWVRQKMN